MYERQSKFSVYRRCSELTPVQKQQRARQLNEGTFEHRLHQGMDRAKTTEEQGELFGVHNIFKFDPEGFVPGRVSRRQDRTSKAKWQIERVQKAQDKFVADLIEAEYEEEEEGVEDDDEVSSRRSLGNDK